MEMSQEIEILEKILEEARCGAGEIKCCTLSPNILAAADHVFRAHGYDPGEYQGFLIGVAWAILTDQV